MVFVVFLLLFLLFLCCLCLIVCIVLFPVLSFLLPIFLLLLISFYSSLLVCCLRLVLVVLFYFLVVFLLLFLLLFCSRDLDIFFSFLFFLSQGTNLVGKELNFPTFCALSFVFLYLYNINMGRICQEICQNLNNQKNHSKSSFSICLY